MDVSKLPKLSQTPRPAGDGPPPPDPNPNDERHPHYYPADRVTVGGEAWISMIIGAVILLSNQNFNYWLAGHTDRIPPVIDSTNATIPYVQSYFFVRDLSLFAFGAALLLDGVLLLIMRPWSILLGLTVTIIATLLNLYTAVRFHTGFGLQLFAILAVIFGLYTALYQWKLLRLLTTGKAAPMT